MSGQLGLLQRTWKEVQAEHNERLQRSRLVTTLYPLFLGQCSGYEDSHFRQTFGDGTALVALLSKMLCRTTREALRAGYPSNVVNADDLLRSSEHESLVSFLGTVADTNFYEGTVGRGAYDEVIRILTLNNIPSMLVALHKSFCELSVHSNCSIEIDTVILCVAKKQFSILHHLIAFPRVVEELKSSNSLLFPFETFEFCIKRPTAASSSLTAMSHDIATTLLRSHSSWIQGSQTEVFRVLVGAFNDARDCTGDSLPRASSLHHLLQCLEAVLIAFPPKKPDEIDLAPNVMVTSLLSVEECLESQHRLLDGILDCVGSLAVTPLAPQQKEAKKQKSGFSFASLGSKIASAPSQLSKLVHQGNAHQEVLPTKRPISFPSVVEALLTYTLCSRPKTQLPICRRFVRLVTTDDLAVTDAIVSRILTAFSDGYQVLSPEVQEIVNEWIQGVSTRVDVSTLKSALLRLSVILQSAEAPEATTVNILKLDSALLANEEVAPVVLQADIEKVATRYLEALSTRPSLPLVQQLSVFWKVLLRKSEFVSNCDTNDCVCLLLNATYCDVGCDVKSSIREMLTAYISVKKEAISCILQCVLDQTVTGESWGERISSQLLSILHALAKGKCSADMIKSSGIEIILSLLQGLEYSRNVQFDLQTICSILSLLLPQVRFSEVWRMINVSVSKKFERDPRVIQFLVDLCSGSCADLEGIQRYIKEHDSGIPVLADELGLVSLPPDDQLSCELREPYHLLLRWCDSDELKRVLIKLAELYPSVVEDDMFVNFVVENKCYPLLPLLNTVRNIPIFFSPMDDALPFWEGSVFPDARAVRRGIEFRGSGGAGGVINVEPWPPTSGYTISSWCYWSTRGDVSTRFVAPLWSVSWTQGETTCKCSLKVDGSAGVSVFVILVGGQETFVPLPIIPRNKWVHVALVHQKNRIASSEVLFFIDGVVAKRQVAAYPTSTLSQAASQFVTREINVKLGFEEGERIPAVAIRQGSLQLYETALSACNVASLYSAPDLEPQSCEWGSSLSNKTLESPVLRQFELSYLSTLRGEQTYDTLDGLPPIDPFPRQRLVLAINPSCFGWKEAPLNYLDNKICTLTNLADPSGSFLDLHGAHSAPFVASDPCHVLVSDGGLDTLLGWLEDCVVVGLGTSSDIAVVLRLLSRCTTKVELAPPIYRDIAFRVASIIQQAPSSLDNNICVEAIQELCLSRLPGRHNSLVASNIHSLELVLFNWSFLTQLSPEYASRLLKQFRDSVLSVANPLHKFNARRLFSVDFHLTLLRGLAQHFAVYEVVTLAIDVLEGYLLGVDFDRRVMSDIFLFLAETVPPINGEERRTEHFPCLSYIVLIRNLVLRLLCLLSRTASSSALLEEACHGCPSWWIVTMTKETSHPVTVALSLQLLTFMTQKPGFRTLLERHAVYLALQASLSHFCFSEEVLSLILNFAVDKRKNILQPSTTLLEERIERGSTVDSAALGLFFHLLKHLLLSTQKAIPFPSHQKALDYFAELSVSQSVARKRFRKVGMLVLSLARMKLRKKSIVVALQETTANEGELLRRGALVTNCINQVALLLMSFDTVYTALANGISIKPLDPASWMLLGLLPEDVTFPGTSSFSSPKSQKSESETDTPQSPQHDQEDEDEGYSRIGSSFAAVSDGERKTSKWKELEPINAPLFNSLSELYSGVAEVSLYQNSTPSVSPLLSNVKSTQGVALLHHILHNTPQGAGEVAVEWYQCQVIKFWVDATSRLVRRSSLASESGLSILRNALSVAQYLTDRMSSGLAAPAEMVGGLLSTLFPALERAPLEGKTLRLVFYDWIIFVVSPSFHQWNTTGLQEARELVTSYGMTLLGDSQLANPEHFRWIFSRMVDISLLTITDYDSTLTEDSQNLGKVFQAMLVAGQAGLGQILIDSGGGGRPRMDLLHGGFDVLLQPLEPVSMFLSWFADNKYQITEFFRKLSAGTSAIQFNCCNSKRLKKWASKEQDAILREAVRTNQRRDESFSLLGNRSTKQLSSSSFADPAVLHYRYAVSLNLVKEASTDEEVAVPMRGLWCRFGAPTEFTKIPSTAFIRASGAYLAADDIPSITEHSNVKLTPGASRLVKKFLRPEAQLFWIGNVYLLQGTESLICTAMVTQTSLVFVSNSQVTEAGDFFVSALRHHDAASCQMKQGDVVTKVLRRFLPRAPAAAMLSSATLATFRHSQYFRQLRTQQQEAENSCVWEFPVQPMKIIHHRRFQHQSAAIELEFVTGESIFFVVLSSDLTMSKSDRNKLTECFQEVAPWLSLETSNLKKSHLQQIQKKWQKKQVSTYRYLLTVNDAASRTFSELSQYPVMPWILSDYGSTSIDLNSASSFRDLSKPVAALSQSRAAELVERYKEWVDDNCPPFHHGTHYSSSAIVMYYQVRLQPYTSLAIRYQGGRLDVADRLFHSVDEAWKSCSSATGRDVKELIPEMFSQPKLFFNDNNVDLGTKRDGTALNHVVLPPWTKQDPDRFVAVHRCALEMDTVGQGVHAWIDLIFGHKQQGEEAAASVNVFHHLTYDIGLEQAMTDATNEEDKRAIVAQVDNFGITPKQVFKSPHPKRPAGGAIQPLQSVFFSLISQLVKKPSAYCFAKQYLAGQRITKLSDSWDGTVLCSTRTCQFVVTKPLQYVELRPASGSLAFFLAREHTILSVIPSIAAYGCGRISQFSVANDGMTLCIAGTKVGTVLVLRRHSSEDPFAVHHFLRPSDAASASTHVSYLRFHGRYLVIGYEGQPDVFIWAVGLGFCSFVCAVSLPWNKESPELKSVSVNQEEGVLYIAREQTLYAISLGTGYVIATASLPAMSGDTPLAPISCIAPMELPSFSPLSVLLAGHADGTLSFWGLMTALSGPDIGKRSFLLHSRLTSERRNAVVSLLTQAQTLSVVASYEDGTVMSLSAPSYAPDQD